MPDQRGCNGKPLCQPSQPPHEYRPGIRPKDATDKEARTPRSRGRSVVVLYNAARTHLSVNKDAPMARMSPFLASLGLRERIALAASCFERMYSASFPSTASRSPL